MRLTWTRAVILFATVLLIATLWHGVREVLVADRCLDAGGVFDYAEQRCRTDVEWLPARPGPLFRQPDGTSLLAAAAIALAGIGIFGVLDRVGRSSQAAG